MNSFGEWPHTACSVMSCPRARAKHPDRVRTPTHEPTTQTRIAMNGIGMAMSASKLPPRRPHGHKRTGNAVMLASAMAQKGDPEAGDHALRPTPVPLRMLTLLTGSA